jgi:hypothetical protein
MNENDNNFEELKRLLKLKQHEVPPPGYYNNFSSQVMSRIRAGEAGGSRSEARKLAPWLASLVRIFEVKPGVVGALASSLCLVLLIGIVMIDRPDSTPAGVLADSGSASASAPDLASAVPAATADTSGITISTNPAVSLQPTVTLFSQQQNSLFQPAGFTPGQQ